MEEIPCDSDLTLEDIQRMSLVVLADGTVSQQVVVVT